jgi:hypothetical protein
MVYPATDGKRVRRSIPRSRGALLLTLLANWVPQPRANPRFHWLGGIIPDDLHPNPCYPAPIRKREADIRVAPLQNADLIYLIQTSPLILRMIAIPVVQASCVRLVQFDSTFKDLGKVQLP